MKSFRQRAAEGLQTGDSFTLSRCFSQEDIQRFAQISATTIRCISMHRPVESTVETSPSHHTTIDQLHPASLSCALLVFTGRTSKLATEHRV